MRSSQFITSFLFFSTFLICFLFLIFQHPAVSPLLQEDGGGGGLHCIHWKRLQCRLIAGRLQLMCQAPLSYVTCTPNCCPGSLHSSTLHLHPVIPLPYAPSHSNSHPKIWRLHRYPPSTQCSPTGSSPTRLPETEVQIRALLVKLGLSNNNNTA